MPATQHTIDGKNFTATEIGSFERLDAYSFTHELLPIAMEGKVFLKSILGLTSAEISFNKLPPNASMPFHHKHQRNEEIYLFIQGNGEFMIDDTIVPVSEGTVIRVAPEGVRCWRNVSTEPLYYVVIQAAEGSYGAGSNIEDGLAVKIPVVWPSGSSGAA